MRIPIDTATLTAWSSLLGLTEQQTTDTLADIETTLRRGYAHRPPALRHLTFDELTTGMDVDRFALVFLESGLRRAGNDEAADAVLCRIIAVLHSEPAG